jgi:hypothetical protein
MNKISMLFLRYWRPATMGLALAVIAYVLFFHNLGNLIPGYASEEIANYQSASSLHAIMQNPINAPFKLVVLLVTKLGYHHVLAVRIVAASFGLLACLLFYMLLRAWYSYRVTFLATVLFASSSGFLHVARLGTAFILQMGVLLLMGTFFWHRRTNHRTLAAYVLIVSFVLLWYVPGMIWLELFAVALLQGSILETIKKTGWLNRICWSLLIVILSAPLVYASIKNIDILRAAAGLPPHFVSIIQVIKNLGHTVLSLSIYSSGTSLQWLGHVPLLGTIGTVLMLLGAYWFVKHWRSVRTIGIFGAGIISLVLISLGGPVNIVSILPLLYLLIAAGLHVLLSRWLTVFPRNPVARYGGVALIFVMVFFSILYQVQSYYVAWPHNTATKQVFTLHE